MFSCSGPIFRYYANQRTWEACLIDCMETLDNIYRNGSPACHSKGKIYRDAQLRELVHSVAIENAPEHVVTYGSEPAGEKCGEGETAARQQPPQPSGCEAATSS
jgi:hypothetical protein